MCDIICQKIIEGTGITKLCEKPEFPSRGVIDRWCKAHPDFKDDLERARQLAGDYHYDKVIEKADEAMEEDDPRKMANYRIHLDGHKWAAEKSDPSRYGNQTKIVGDKDQPLTFIIDTGIHKEKEDYEIKNAENLIEFKPREQK